MLRTCNGSHRLRMAQGCRHSFIYSGEGKNAACGGCKAPTCCAGNAATACRGESLQKRAMLGAASLPRSVSQLESCTVL